MYEPSLVARTFHSYSNPAVAFANSTPGVFWIAAVTPRSSSTFSSSGTVHGSFSIGICQNSSYFSTAARRTSVFFAIELAFATSVASPAIRLISSGATTGLLAKPHTPL